ncbi:uncharacterized protein VTP21DRAFT_2900 [Calcarisporiella thermophila]|uniref:uncharacterized protein n=1 Tax=Calcarisporiella thermophila TaxID=911321 RepID=UPI003743E21C
MESQRNISQYHSNETAHNGESRSLIPKTNRLSSLYFVLAFGVVSMLSDIVYEGARAITGPFLAKLGASGALVGIITGTGEAVALVLRLFIGRLSDRTRKYWTLTIAGYAITIVSVPLLSVANTLWQAVILVIAERFGKAVRAPARDTMLAHAGSHLGLGRAFAFHEALDESGALIGPLIVAGMIALSGYKLAFAILAIPGILALMMLAWIRNVVPNPSAYEHEHDTLEHDQHQPSDPPSSATYFVFSSTYWIYSLFTAFSMAGFATFGLLSFHLETKRVVEPVLIPVIYSTVMGTAGLSALCSGRLYDRIGMSVLVIAPLLGIAAPFLFFATNPTQAWLGNLLWGAATGIHGSTMRAAVAGLVPSVCRGQGYGTFTAVYGLAWLMGGSIIGILYDRNITWAITFSVSLQALSFVVLSFLLGRRTDHRT